MSHRVNVMLDEEAWAELQKIERGERSRFVSRAIKEAVLRHERYRALERLDEVREGLEHPPGTAEEWVREDRDSR